MRRPRSRISVAPCKAKIWKRPTDQSGRRCRIAGRQAARSNFPDCRGRRRRGSWAGGGYGLVAYSGLRDGDGGSGAAGAERIPGGRESHHEGPAEWSAEAVGRGARRAGRDRSSPGPQGSGRRRHRRSAGHDLWLVSQARRPQVRWLAGQAISRQALDQAGGRRADDSHGQREPRLGLRLVRAGEGGVGYLLKRPVGRTPTTVRRFYASFSYQAASWTMPRRVVAKVEWLSIPKTPSTGVRGGIE